MFSAICRARAGTAPGPDRARTFSKPVLHRRDRIGAGAYGGVKEHHAIVGEAQLLAEPLFQQFRGKPHLQFHDLARGIIDPVIFAQLRVIGGKEIFVEIQPEIGFRFQEVVRVERFERRCSISNPTDSSLRASVCRAVPASGPKGRCSCRASWPPRPDPVSSRRKGGPAASHRSRSARRHPRTWRRRNREEELPPFVGEKLDRRSGLQRVFDLGAQETGQRRKVFGEPGRGVRNDRLPAKKSAEQAFQSSASSWRWPPCPCRSDRRAGGR